MVATLSSSVTYDQTREELNFPSLGLEVDLDLTIRQLT